MRIRRRSAIVLASAAACGVGMIAFPVSAWAPPVVPGCVPKASSFSDSCVRLQVNAVDGSLDGTPPPPENIRLGVRTRSVFTPAAAEVGTVSLRFDDFIRLNLAGIPTCPGSELAGKNIAQAWEQCGPGADGNPASEGNAYLSTGLGGNVSGIASTVPPSNFTACTMVFKGADNNHVTLYARFPVANEAATAAGCNNPASNTGGSATVIFTGTLTHQPVASPYDWTLTVPNVQSANPSLDDFYATLVRGAAFRATCESPLEIEGVFTYVGGGGPTDTISPPYAGTQDSCPP
jgi:hypothetical protein